jgi:hypothetical protein
MYWDRRMELVRNKKYDLQGVPKQYPFSCLLPRLPRVNLVMRNPQNVALRAVRPNSLYSKVIFSYPTCFGRILPKLIPWCIKSRVLKISSDFRMKYLQDSGIDNVLFLEKSCTKMYTIFSAVQRQQRKSDVMPSMLVSRAMTWEKLN